MADDYGAGQQVTLEAEVVEAAFASHVTVCPLCSFEACNRQTMLKHLKDRHKTTISELKQHRGEAVKQTLDSYTWAKTSAPLPLGHAIGAVEQGVVVAADRAMPTYEHYLHDKVSYASKAACGALNNLERSYPQIATLTTDDVRGAGAQYYEQSNLKRAVDVAVATKDVGADAVSRVRNAAITTVTIGLGAAVVSTQLSIAAALAATNLGIDAVVASKNAGVGTVRAVHRSEQAMLDAVRCALVAGRGRLGDARTLAASTVQGPVDKMTDNTNALLDVLDTLIDRYIAEQQVDQTGEPTKEPFDACLSLPLRLAEMGGKVSDGLTAKAHSFILNPVQKTLRLTIDELRQSLVLLEYVHSARTWTSQRAMEGVDRMSDSVNKLKSRLDEQAKKYDLKPDVLLLRLIRMSSTTLSTAADQLLAKSVTMLSDNAVDQIRSAVDYVHHLDQAFAEAQNLYEVRDEVVSEARGKLTVVEQSLIGAVDRLTEYPPLSWMSRSSRSLSASLALDGSSGDDHLLDTIERSHSH